MDLVSSCKDKLQYFRIKELKDVLTQLGLSKQGKKQDLVDRILAVVNDDQVSKIWMKRNAVGKEEVARLVDDTYRKMQLSGAADLATKPQCTSDSSTLKLKEEVDDTYQLEMKIRCLCGSSLVTESMIKDIMTGRTIGQGREEGGVYHLLQSPIAASATSSAFAVPSASLWHQWLGHPPISQLRRVLPQLPSTTTLECEACQLRKHHRSSFPSSEH